MKDLSVPLVSNSFNGNLDETVTDLESLARAVDKMDLHSGDMAKSVYDSTNVQADAFNTDHHHDGMVNGIYTLVEREELADIMSALVNEGNMIYRGRGSNAATIAAGATVTVVDTYHGPETNLIDEDDATHWASWTPHPGAWFYIDLGSAKTIYSYRLYQWSGWWEATQYTVETSPDAINWTLRYTRNVITIDETIVLSSAVAARYWRFHSTAGNTGAGWNVYSVELHLTLPPINPLAIGIDGQVLESVSGVPAWVTVPVMHDPLTVSAIANGFSVAAGQVASLAAATAAVPGAMSAAYAAKLDGVEAGAEVNEATFRQVSFTRFLSPMLEALTWTAAQIFQAAVTFETLATVIFKAAVTFQSTAAATFQSTIAQAVTSAGAGATFNQSGTGDIAAFQDAGVSTVRVLDQGGIALVPQAGGFQNIAGLVAYDSVKKRLVLYHESHNYPVPIDPRNTCRNKIFTITYA